MKLAVKKILDSICRIDVYFKSSCGSGTGFIVNSSYTGFSKYIITNAHVLENAERVEACFHIDSRELKFEIPLSNIIISDFSRDLAIIRISNPPGQSLNPTHGIQMDLGDDFYSAGYPHSSESPKIIHGIISGVEELPVFSVENKALVLDGQVHPGQSGSPVCDTSGNLHAIVFASMKEHNTIGYSIPLTGLSDMLDIASRLENKLNFSVPTNSNIRLNVNTLAQLQDWLIKTAGSPVSRLSCNSNYDCFWPIKRNGDRVYLPENLKKFLKPAIISYLQIRPLGGRFFITGKALFGYNNEQFEPIAKIETIE